MNSKWFDSLVETLSHTDRVIPLGSILNEGQLRNRLRHPFPGGLTRWLKSKELKQLIASWTPLDRPEFWGHMTPPPIEHLWLADLLISKANQNLVKLETALGATNIERALSREVASWIWGDRQVDHAMPQGRPDLPSATLFTSGGTLANLTALWVARNQLLEGTRLNGLGTTSLEIWVSERGHYSIQKSADLLGLGRNAVHKIPVNSRHQMDTQALEACLQKRRRKTPVVIVGIAGSTETGSIDPLPKLARIAKREGAWFHVDAAWGGGLLLHPQGPTLLKGIDHADSVTLDGHKLLYTTMGLGMVCFKDPSKLQAIASEAQYILRPGSLDLGRFSIEGSRPFHAFRLFWLLAVEGRRQIAQRLDHSLKLTRAIAAWIQTQPDLELTSPPETNLLTYRFFPPEWRNKRMVASAWQELANKLDQLQISIQESQRSHGQHFVSRTRFKGLGPMPTHESVVLRIVPGHPKQSLALFKHCIAEQRAIASAALK